MTTTMNDSARPLEFMQIFTGTLLDPVNTFRALSIDADLNLSRHFAFAAIVVAAVFGLDGFRLTSANHLESAPFHVLFSAGYGLVLWLAIAGTVSLLSACFNTSSKGAVKSAFVTLGWSMLPWLFTAPLFAMKNALGALYSVLLCIPLLWIFCLQLIAINQSFRMQSWQTLVLVFIVPGVYSTVQFMQFVQSLSAIFPGLFA